MIDFVVNGLSVASVYGLVALGFALSFGVLGVVWFAHGEVAVVAGYIFYFGASTLGAGVAGSILLGLIGSGLVALIGYDLVVRRVLPPVPHLNQIVATVGVALVIQGAVRVAFGSDPISVDSPMSRATIEIGGASIASVRFIGISLTIVVLILLAMLISRTEFGRQVRAVAIDAGAAEIVGIRRRRIERVVFVVAGMMAGVSGVIVAMAATLNPSSGLPLTLAAIAIVIIGGSGNLIGTLLAALAVGFVEASVGRYIPGGAAWSPAVVFAGIAVVSVIRWGGKGVRALEA